MRTWQVEDVEACFSELLDASLKEGPQIVTRGGVETAVLLRIEQWGGLQRRSEATLKELLLGNGPRFETVTPPRITGGFQTHPELSEATIQSAMVDAISGAFYLPACIA